MQVNCPKCDADVSDTYEPADHSVGIMSGGWFCDACDLPIGEDEVGREPLEGDVGIMSATEFLGGRPIGTPISELSTQPGPKNDLSHPDHARYAEWCRIARSWGHD